MGEYYGLLWGCRCCGNGDGRDAGLGGVPSGAFPGLGECQCSLLCLLFRCSCLLTISVQRNGGILRFAMGLLVLWKRLWAGCRAGRRAFWRAFPGLGERQGSLLCLLFRCSCLLTISVQRNRGNTTVCNGAAGVVETAMGGMPGWAARLLAHCPALANAKVRFFVFFFVVLVC